MGWRWMALNQGGLQGMRRFFCSQHPAGGIMIALVLFIKLEGTSSNTSAYEDNSKIYHVFHFGRHIHSLKLFLVLTQPRFLMDLPLFPHYRNRKSQKPPENQAFQGTSLEQPVQPRDAGTAAASLPGADLANPDYFVL